jgi:hypothetical protein
MTELVTEIPRCFSTSIQSDVACRLLLRALTVPAIWIAPPYSSSFSVSVVLPGVRVRDDRERPALRDVTNEIGGKGRSHLS